MLALSAGRHESFDLSSCLTRSTNKKKKNTNNNDSDSDNHHHHAILTLTYDYEYFREDCSYNIKHPSWH